MKFNKKIVASILLGVSFFSLTACGDKQSVYIINEAGEKEKVSISVTDDTKVVSNALTYVAQNNYDNADKLGFDIDCNLDIQSLDVPENKSTDDFTLAFLYDKSQGLNLEIQESTTLSKGDQQIASTISSKTYYEINQSYVYNHSQVEINEEKAETKVKLKVEDYFADLLPGLTIPSLDIEEKFDVFDFYKDFYGLFPKSKMVISEVNKDKFTLQFQINSDDFLHLFGYYDSYNKDVFINFDVNVSLEDGSIINAQSNANFTTKLDYFAQIVYEDLEIDFALDLVVNKEDFQLEILSESEKATYEEF